MSTTKSVLKDRSFAFALSIIKQCKILTVDKKEYVISRQLLRSGTAVGALIRESKNAESGRDFIHKLGIAQKECDETQYWLELLHQSDYISEASFNELFNDATQILRMIKSSILTVKQKLP